jgi:flagellar biosynthesis/type III secretory pathway M-ring protein FliF/YscJ
MKQGTRLTERQLQGVIHLCAGAVAGLSPEKVEVMDASGLLTAQTANSAAGMASTTLEAEAAREAHLTRKAQEQLDAIFGPGRSQVRVGVKLDFAKRNESTSDPTIKVALEEQSTASDEKNESAAPGGVAGTAPNVEGESRPSTVEPLRSTKTKEDTTTKYVVGTKKTTLEDEVGRIRGMTVSILLPLKKTVKPKLDAQGKATDEKEEVFEEYPAAERDRYKELVLNAIGFAAAKDVAAKAEGGANLDARFAATVQSVELWKDPASEISQAGITLPVTGVPIPDLVGYGVAGLVALVILLIARGQLKRSHQAWKEADERSRTQHAEEVKKHAPVVAEVTEEDQEKLAIKARRGEMKDMIRKRITEDPAAASQILRRWMYE